MQHDSVLHRPREAIQCLLIVIFLMWQWYVGALGLVLFLILIRGLSYPAWQIFLMGILLVVFSVFLIKLQSQDSLSFFEIIHLGFINHLIFWKTLFYQDLKAGLVFIYQQTFYYLLGFPILMAGLLGMVEWIPNSTHEWELKAIQRGKEFSNQNNWKTQFQNWHKHFFQKNKQHIDGTLLGISTTHQAVDIPDWENDYYRSIAEDYLQTTFEVLLTLKEDFDLNTIVNCLEYEELALKTRPIANESLKIRVQRLHHYDSKDITGLQAHLNLLIHSELGTFFQKTQNTFNLAEIIQSNSVVYFALPALRFPSFAKVLGKLIINDIKAVIDRLECKQRIFTVFDEFSVFAGEQVLNLVNMGRGKGIHAIFGTQGLADLKRVDPDFENQLLNCVNTLICHRLNDHESAETVASWVGTQDGFDITAQISEDASTGMGSVKRNKSFIRLLSKPHVVNS